MFVVDAVVLPPKAKSNRKAFSMLWSEKREHIGIQRKDLYCFRRRMGAIRWDTYSWSIKWRYWAWNRQMVPHIWHKYVKKNVIMGKKHKLTYL